MKAVYLVRAIVGKIGVIKENGNLVSCRVHAVDESDAEAEFSHGCYINEQWYSEISVEKVIK